MPLFQLRNLKVLEILYIFFNFNKFIQDLIFVTDTFWLFRMKTLYEFYRKVYWTVSRNSISNILLSRFSSNVFEKRVNLVSEWPSATVSVCKAVFNPRKAIAVPDHPLYLPDLVPWDFIFLKIKSTPRETKSATVEGTKAKEITVSNCYIENNLLYCLKPWQYPNCVNSKWNYCQNDWKFARIFYTERNWVVTFGLSVFMSNFYLTLIV